MVVYFFLVSEKKTCQPIASKIVNVKGPNGAHCVEKILECGCARSCHRVSFHQLYSITVLDEQTSTNKTLQRVITTYKIPQGYFKPLYESLGNSHIKVTGVIVVPFWWLNSVAWYRLGYLNLLICRVLKNIIACRFRIGTSYSRHAHKIITYCGLRILLRTPAPFKNRIGCLRHHC